MSKKWFRYFGSIAGVCLFVLALAVIHHQLEKYHFADIFAKASQTPFSGLLLAVFITALDYFVLTFYDTIALRYLGHPIRYPSIVFASFVGYVFRHGEHFYNFNGLRRYKQKFNPVWQPRYLACLRGLMLPRILTNLVSLISGGITGTITR